jgi:hypothetical protein
MGGWSLLDCRNEACALRSGIEEKINPISRPAPKKARKKPFDFFFFAFKLSIVFCSPWQGEQNTMPGSKAKKISRFFSGLLGGRA